MQFIRIYGASEYGIPGAKAILRRLRTSIVKRKLTEIIIYTFSVEDGGSEESF